MIPFAREVADIFEFLLLGGVLKWDSSFQDDAAMGDAEVVMRGRTYLLRVSRYRGDVGLEIASTSRPDLWLPLDWVIAAIDREPVGMPKRRSIAQGAATVRSNYEAMETALDPANFLATRQAIIDGATKEVRQVSEDFVSWLLSDAPKESN